MPRVGAELIWTPGAGLFEWRLGYQFTGTLFESAGQLTNLNNQIETRGRWRFLPRTSLLYDARFGFISYPTPDVNNPKTSSHPLRALIGINGLITPSFALLAMVGWGASFYSDVNTTAGARWASPSDARAAENFDSVIGQAEVKWFLTPNPSSDPAAASLTLSSISVGFLRDFYDSYIGYYFERDRGYANLSYFYGGRFLLVVDGGAGPMVYPSMPVLQNQQVASTLSAPFASTPRSSASIASRTRSASTPPCATTRTSPASPSRHPATRPPSTSPSARSRPTSAPAG